MNGDRRRRVVVTTLASRYGRHSMTNRLPREAVEARLRDRCRRAADDGEVPPAPPVRSRRHDRGRERIEAEIDRVACREAQQGGRYGGSVLQLENRIQSSTKASMPPPAASAPASDTVALAMLTPRCRLPAKAPALQQASPLLGLSNPPAAPVSVPGLRAERATPFRVCAASPRSVTSYCQRCCC